jgi:hypothetical protein
MNQRALTEAYLDYLAPQIGADPDGETYWDLLRLMQDKEYIWFIPWDDNRLVDGLDVRAEWMDRLELAVEMGPCSFLEVVVGLSRRMAFFTSESAEGWGWQFLVNIGLDRMSDPLSRYKARRADDIMDTVIFRNYEPDGTGGFFPLTHPKEDQRKVELWYQMSAYVNEIHPEY